MQMPVGITKVVAVEVESAFIAQPFAHVEMIIRIDVNVVAEVFAPGELRRQLVGASVERELEVVVLIDGVEDVARGLGRIDEDAAGRLFVIGRATQQPRRHEA
jgi:hypothetical protein